MKQSKEMDPIEKRIPKANFIVTDLPHVGKCTLSLQERRISKYPWCPRSTT